MNSITDIYCAYIALFTLSIQVLGSIVVSIPACHAGDRGSIPRRGGHIFYIYYTFLSGSLKHSV